jgi:hypothetical protein
VRPAEPSREVQFITALAQAHSVDIGGLLSYASTAPKVRAMRIC